MDWWVTSTAQASPALMSTDLLFRALVAGEVSADAFICRVGDCSWTSIREVAPFAAALAARSATIPAPDSDRTVVDLDGSRLASSMPPSDLDLLHQFDDPAERTLVDHTPYHLSTVLTAASDAAEELEGGPNMDAQSASVPEPPEQ
jgi:hypothetical protein